MRPGLTLQVAPVELVQSLKRDAATFLGAKPGGDFLPRLALLALLADEIHKWFKAAVERPSAAGAFAFNRLGVIDDFWIHQRGV